MSPLTDGLGGSTGQARPGGELDPSARAKADFFANVSHEIRTPLTAILGFTELAERCLPAGPGSEESRDYLRAVRRNGESLLGLITDVLELARIESGEAAPLAGPCDLSRLLLEVESLTRGQAESKGLTLGVERVGTLPASVWTDAGRVRYVLAHLVGNALKFTERGGILLRVTPEPAAAGGQLRFEVTDTGSGMTEAELARLFQPFSRADAARKPTPAGSGAGVGLALCRRITEQLGGTLAVRSQPGLGSVFTLVLPARPGTAAPGESRAPAPAPGVGASPRPHKLAARVLVAEDNRDNQRVIAVRLTMAGANVTVASNGRDALDLARAARDGGRPFGLIVMDMQMPVLDGYEATRALRVEGFETPIVALTAHAMPEDREECLRFGCDEYCTKPINWDVLLAALDRLLRQGRGAGRTPSLAG